MNKGSIKFFFMILLLGLLSPIVIYAQDSSPVEETKLETKTSDINAKNDTELKAFNKQGTSTTSEDNKKKEDKEKTAEMPKKEESASEESETVSESNQGKVEKTESEVSELKSEKDEVVTSDKNKNEETTATEDKSETKEELDARLQLDRRADVIYEGRVRFKNGSAIWAVEDPGLGTPKLEVQAPEQIDIAEEEINFRVFTNYFPFINNWELKIYSRDLNGFIREIDTLTGKRKDLYNIVYPIKPGTYEVGDAIFYQLKVFQSEKVFDLVQEKRIEFVKRVENQNLDERDDTVRVDSLEAIWGGNSIEKQNIPIRGSRVRIVGKNFPLSQSLEYRGQNLQIDQQGNFIVEEHFPVGKHQIQVKVSDRETKDTFIVPFDLEVTGNYFFAVGIADMRVGQNKLSERVVGIGNEDNYDGKVFTDGRLAFYLRGKIQGKYLITAQMDTTEGPIENMFDGVFRKDSEALFRRLDPDRYYPVYGDNSTTTETAPSQGQLYVKIEVDQSYVMWGNDNLGTNRTLLSQYNRTLYGAHTKYNSRIQTKYGENKTKVNVFAANPNTFLGHNEFRTNGGRVYRLRHNDVVQGSEKVVLELRDRDTGLLISSSGQVVLEPFKDYEFDYLAGRVVLTREVTTYDLDGASSITTGGNNNSGREQYFLVVDYEYNPTGSDLDDVSFGGTAEKWLGDHVSVGGTYVSEQRTDSDYELVGIDASLRLGQQSFVKVERSQTESVQTLANFVSDDGGLSFVQKDIDTSNTIPDQKGKAFAVESQFFLNDFIKSKSTDGVLTTWYRAFEAGFSTARRQSGNDLVEYGFDYEMSFSTTNTVKSKLAVTEETDGREEQILVLSYGKDFGNGTTVSTEYRQENIENTSTGQDDSGQIVGLQVNQRLNKSWTIYGRAQETVETEGNYEDNARYAVGTNFRITNKVEGTAEYSDGDRGENHLVGVGYNVDESYRIYTNFDRSVDRSSGVLSDGITLGQRKRFKNGFTLTQENQFTTTDTETGLGQLYGLDYNLNSRTSIRSTYGNVSFENVTDGSVTVRENIGLGVTYTLNQDLSASTQLSYVEDEGVSNVRQFLVTNSLKWRLTPSHTFLIEGDYSTSEDPETSNELARFIEGNLGYAYRPILNDRFNFFFRYTYLYDLDSQAQENARNDQRVNIISAEGSYDLTRRWEIGSRIAQKIGSERLIRGQGPWLDSTTSFAQLRARYHLIKKWDGLFELRAVDTVQAEQSEAGFLLGIDYHLGGNLKLGFGYNFTRFNDDLVNFNFDSQGWFINVVGKL